MVNGYRVVGVSWDLTVVQPRAGIGDADGRKLKARTIGVSGAETLLFGALFTGVLSREHRIRR